MCALTVYSTHLFLVLLAHSSILFAAETPPGYFAFEKASKVHGVPPRVRKPPYVSADVPCPGAVKSDLRLAPKDNLCGDLNRGYVPLNPLMQNVDGQPYPFELIKNKTLHFLARSLPFLKQDIANIPKVAKLPTDSSLMDTEASPSFGNKNNKFDFQSNHVHAPSSTYPHHHFIQRRSLQNFTRLRNELRREANFAFGMNLTEARQKVCEQNEGMMCQVMQALTGGQASSGLLNALSQAVQVVSAASNAANTAHSLSSLASLLQQLSSNGGGGGGGGSSGGSSSGTNSATGSSSSSTSSSTASSSGDITTKSTFSQVISLLAALNNPSTTSTSNNNFNPLSAIVEYFMSVNPATISGLLPARRKKPLDLDDLASEAMTVSQVPPTPCPSIEEYVAPVYARNYQGVWKYVVQIPNEGYFTQTVQKTSCIKGRCDFMDGVCHESPRWVSLLVAEVFYPQPKFPNLMASGSEMKPIHTISPIKPKYPVSNHLNSLPHHYNQHLNSMGSLNPVGVGPLLAMRPSSTAILAANEYHHPVDQYLNRKIGLMKEEPSSLAKPRFIYRTARMHNDEDMNSNKKHQTNKKENLEDHPSTPSSATSSIECDGHDNIGCYQMRVYYDWFLIPGACKCWKKSSSQSSLDTLKKIFIGK